MNQLENTNTLFQTVKEVVQKAKNLAYRSSNAIMLSMYWEVGQLIVEDEQHGKAKAIYGDATLKNLSKSLTLEFGTGFDERNLNNMRAFYTAFPIWNAVRTELSWTHYRMISRIKIESQRLQYIDLSIEGNWDTRTLERNIKTQYVGRILASATTSVTHPKNIIKDPYILEFYGLPNDIKLTERS